MYHLIQQLLESLPSGTFGTHLAIMSPHRVRIRIFLTTLISTIRRGLSHPL